jgi:hypothetical protein
MIEGSSGRNMANDEKLKHSIMIQFGTAPWEPTDEQLSQIKAAIVGIQHSGKHASNDDWRSAVFQYCPSTGRYKYAGVDNSDLNTLLAVATQSAKG